MIGAIATILAGIIPAVIAISNRGSPTSTSTSTSDTEIASEPAQAPATPIAVAPETVAGSGDLDLDLLADACYEGDWFACDDLYELAPAGSDLQWYGGTCGGILDTVSEETCEYLIDYLLYLEALADGCEWGDLLDCDELYRESPIESDYEYFGSTCGGRVTWFTNGRCWELA